MSESLLTPDQVTVLDHSTMRAAQIGLLQRFADFKRYGISRLLTAISEADHGNIDLDPEDVEDLHLSVEEHSASMSFEIQPIFTALSSEPDRRPYAFMHIDKVDSSTGSNLPSSGGFLGRIALPGAYEPVGTALPHMNFKEVDLYFAVLRVQHQLDVDLDCLGQRSSDPDISYPKPSDHFRALIKAWPNI
jgi:hypothetical protein